MPYSPFRRPELPPHILVRYEPPDSSGEEALTFRSEQRRVRLKGRSFREFRQRVLPLLDGRHSLAEIEAEVADEFRPEDLREGLQLLADNNLLQEGEDEAVGEAEREALGPQLSYFHELGEDPGRSQARLASKTVTVVGLSALGAAAGRALASAGVGTLRLADPLPVTAADTYLSAGAFPPGAVGRPRAEVLAEELAAGRPAVAIEVHREPIDSDEAAGELAEGSDFLLSALDPGLSKTVYKLNRACLAAGVRWSSARVSAFEAVLGPTVTPWESACYLCYQMRAVACAEDPEVEFDHVKFLDRRQRDDSGRRENLVFGVGIAGNLLALEAFRVLGGREAAAAGAILVLDLLELSSGRHVVLRKPWCPACFPDNAPGGAGGGGGG